MTNKRFLVQVHNQVRPLHWKLSCCSCGLTSRPSGLQRGSGGGVDVEVCPRGAGTGWLVWRGGQDKVV